MLFLSFAAGAAFQALAMRSAEMGMAYLLSLGLEVVLAFAIAYLFFAESLSWWKLVGVASIVAGMVLMHLGGSPSGGAEASEQPRTPVTTERENNSRPAEGVC